MKNHIIHPIKVTLSIRHFTRARVCDPPSPDTFCPYSRPPPMPQPGPSLVAPRAGKLGVTRERSAATVPASSQFR